MSDVHNIATTHVILTVLTAHKKNYAASPQPWGASILGSRDQSKYNIV